MLWKEDEGSHIFGYDRVKIICTSELSGHF